MDIVAFDISDIRNIIEVSKVENVLENYVISLLEKNVVYNYEEILIGWNVEEKYREVYNEFFIDVTFRLIQWSRWFFVKI